MSFRQTPRGGGCCELLIRDEPVAQAVYRHDSFGLRGVLLDLLPQRGDPDIDRSGRRSLGVLPDVRQQLVARDHASTSLDEVLEDSQLEVGEVEFFAAA